MSFKGQENTPRQTQGKSFEDGEAKIGDAATSQGTPGIVAMCRIWNRHERITPQSLQGDPGPANTLLLNF